MGTAHATTTSDKNEAKPVEEFDKTDPSPDEVPKNVFSTAAAKPAGIRIS